MTTALALLVTLFSLLYVLPVIIRVIKRTWRAFVTNAAQPVGAFFARQAREWKTELSAAWHS